MISIFYSNGEIKTSVLPNTGSKRKFSVMNEDYVSLRFSLYAPVMFSIGDYIEYEGRQYYITEKQAPRYNASTGGYEYDLRFDAYYYRWNAKIFKFVPESTGGSEESWNLTGALSTHMEVFLRNIKALGFKYSQEDFVVDIDTSVTTEAKLLQYSSTYLVDALSMMAEAFECEWWIEGKTIHFGRCESEDSVRLEFGREVSAMSDRNYDKQPTRFFAFGAARNLPKDYRKIDGVETVVNGVSQKRLMLPEDTPYIDIKPGLSLDQAVETIVIFDDIYPRLNSIVDNVYYEEGQYKDPDGNPTGETYPIYFIHDTVIKNFDEKRYMIEGTELRIKFQSGLMAGMDFAVTLHSSNDKGTTLEIVRNEDYGRYLPDGTLHPSLGDSFVLYNYDVTFLYEDAVKDAENELKAKTEEHVAEQRKKQTNIDCTLAADYARGVNPSTGAEDPSYEKRFALGQKVELVNPAVLEENVHSRVIGYEYDLDLYYNGPVYTIGESVSYSRISNLEAQVVGINNKVNTEVTNIEKKISFVGNDFFALLNERGVETNDINQATYIKPRYALGFASDSFISAFGVNPGGGGGGGVTDLKNLHDVYLNNVKGGQVLKWDDTIKRWVNGDDSGYVQVSWNDIQDKPDVFPPSYHVHEIADINGLADALKGFASKTDLEGVEKVTADAINGLTTKVNENAEVVASELEALGLLIATNRTGIANLGKSLDATNTNVKANKDAIDALKGRMTTAEGNITSLNSSLATTNTNVATNAQGISNLNTELGKTNTNVTANATAISGLTTRMSTAEGNITTNANNLKALKDTFDSMFEWDNGKIKAKAGLYSVDFISAFGKSEGGGGGGASALVDLTDVTISNPTSGQVLKWNGSKWVNAEDSGYVSIGWDDLVTKPTPTDLSNILGSYYITSSQKGANNGVATLGADGKIPSTQLPSYVDDVLEYASLSAFPVKGETGKIYIAMDTNRTYRWSGSQYAEISESLALGETSSTAYRGDLGKVAYDNALTAVGWGNHALAGYAKASALDAKQDAISDLATIRSNASTAYSWGDHSTFGYAKQTSVDYLKGLIADNEKVTASALGKLWCKANDADSAIADNVRLIANVQRDVNGLRFYLDSLFELDEHGYIRAKRGFYSVDFVSAFGKNDDGGGGGGASSIYDLGGVLINKSTLKEDQVLKYNGEYWVNAEDSGYVSVNWTDIKEKPSTLGGYGITDAKIANGVITLGSNTITPLTQHQSLAGYATETWVNNKNYLTGITSSMVTTALGFTPYNNADFTKANIKSTLGIADWALASSKPTYKTSEVSEETNLYFTDSRAQSALSGHTGNTAIHVTSAEKTTWSAKQSAIADIDTIRSNARNGQTAYSWGDQRQKIEDNEKVSASAMSSLWSKSGEQSQEIQRLNGIIRELQAEVLRLSRIWIVDGDKVTTKYNVVGEQNIIAYQNITAFA